MNKLIYVVVITITIVLMWPLKDIRICPIDLKDPETYIDLTCKIDSEGKIYKESESK